MRRLKAELADGNVYTFTTLTLKEQNVVRKFEDLPEEEAKRMDELSKIEKPSKEQMDELNDLQNLQMKNMLRILMMSLQKKHDEFKVTDKVKEGDIIDKIENLIDIRDMQRFTSFVVIGTLPPEENVEHEFTEIIDLTSHEA